MTREEWIKAGGVARHVHDFQLTAQLVADGQAKCIINADVYECACGVRRIVPPRAGPDFPGALSAVPGVTVNPEYYDPAVAAKVSLALIDASQRIERAEPIR